MRRGRARRLDLASSAGVGQPIGDLCLVEASLALQHLFLYLARVGMSVMSGQPVLQDADGVA